MVFGLVGWALEDVGLSLSLDGSINRKCCIAHHYFHWVIRKHIAALALWQLKESGIVSTGTVGIVSTGTMVIVSRKKIVTL